MTLLQKYKDVVGFLKAKQIEGKAPIPDFLVKETKELPPHASCLYCVHLRGGRGGKLKKIFIHRCALSGHAVTEKDVCAKFRDG